MAPAATVDELLAGQGDWRGALLGELRTVIRTADPEVEEDLKWAKPSNPTGVPAWSHDGLVCTGELYKDKVKLTFFEGASLDDPDRLFNASLDAGARRAIDFLEGDTVRTGELAALIRGAVDHNAPKVAAKATATAAKRSGQKT